MRELVFTAPGDLAWHDAPEPPPPGPRAALVRPLAVARCDLDLPMAAFGIFPGPFVVGHELVAEVVAVGDEVSTVVAGQRVSVPFQVSCGTCGPCLGGRWSACATYRAPAGSAWGFGQRGGGHGGAVTDLLTVPAADHLLLAAPPGLSDAALATLPDNVVDAYRAVGPQLLERPGADVLVCSGSVTSIGLYAVLLARVLGAGRVRYADTDAGRCELAAGLGAEVEHLEAWPHKLERAPITVEGTGTPEGLACTLRSTEDAGVCTTVAIQFTRETPLPMLEMYTRGVTLQVSRADSRRHLPAVLELAASGVLDPLAVPTTIAPWESGAEAWLAPAEKLVLVR